MVSRSPDNIFPSWLQLLLHKQGNISQNTPNHLPCPHSGSLGSRVGQVVLGKSTPPLGLSVFICKMKGLEQIILISLPGSSIP